MPASGQSMRVAMDDHGARYLAVQGRCPGGPGGRARQSAAGSSSLRSRVGVVTGIFAFAALWGVHGEQRRGRQAARVRHAHKGVAGAWAHPDRYPGASGDCAWWVFV